jgi:hypothetical protein
MSKKLWQYTNWAKPETDPPEAFYDVPWELAGFARMPAIFSRHIFPPKENGGHDPTGDFDRDQLRGHLDSHLIPVDAHVWLDVEYAGTPTDPTGSKVVYWQPPQGAPHFYAPWQAGIDFWCELLEFCRDVRPDCYFGIYGQLPHGPYQSVVGDRWKDNLDALAVACRPIANRCDFLLPYLYDHSWWPKNDTLESRIRYWRRHIARARYFFPYCEIFGMSWPEYINLWRARPNPDTVEAQNARLLTGFAWQTHLKTILSLCDGVMIWGGHGWTSYAPNYWKPDSEWWQATLGEVAKRGGAS